MASIKPLSDEGSSDESDKQYYYDLKDYIPGERMIIETTSNVVYDCIYATTEAYGPNGKIRVHSLRELLSEKRYEKTRYSIIFAKEIKSLRFFLPETLPNGCIVNPYYKKLTFSTFISCCNLCLNYEYIPVVDNSFYKIIKILKDSDTISVGLLGTDIGKLRNTNVSLLIIGTKTQVYLFDTIITPKKFFDCGLKDVMQDDGILKIIYDSRVVCDVLYNRFWKTEINNTYDLLVADYSVLQRDDRLKNFNDFRSLNELIDEHLDLPRSIYNELDYVKVKNIIFDRPMKNDIRELGALTVAFYFPLYHEINAEMNKGFSKITQRVIDKRFENMRIIHRQPSEMKLEDIVKEKSTLEVNDDDELIASDHLHSVFHKHVEKLLKSITKEDEEEESKDD